MVAAVGQRRGELVASGYLLDLSELRSELTLLPNEDASLDSFEPLLFASEFRSVPVLRTSFLVFDEQAGPTRTKVVTAIPTRHLRASGIGFKYPETSQTTHNRRTSGSQQAGARCDPCVSR
jgi:hypothetical protein